MANTGRYVPYRAPYVPQADDSLPFDPNDTATGAPWSPQELDDRQAMMGSQQRMQDALGQQAQAQAPPSGLAGILQSPVFQAAVPTALTALSAIFPRHMAVAGPTGMAGFRTLMDTSMMQNRQRQTVASDMAKQAQDDFSRQRFKYAVDHIDGLDPSLQAAIKQEADINLGDAAKHLQSASEAAQKDAFFDQFSGNGPSTAFAAHTQSQPGTPLEGGQQGPSAPATPAVSPMEQMQRSMQPGQSMTVTGGHGQTMTVRGVEPDQYADFRAKWIREHPDNPEGAAQGYIDARKGEGSPEYSAFSKGWIADHPGLDPVHAAAGAAAAYKLIGADNTAAQHNKAIDTYLDAVDKGLKGQGPMPVVPLPSARGGLSPEMLEMISRASERGIDLDRAMKNQLAYVQSVKAMNSDRQIAARVSVDTTERMLANAEKAFQAWEQYGTPVKSLNELEQIALKQVDTPAGHAATALITAITEARRRMALVLQSGTAITDDAAQAAKEMLDPAMPPGNFRAALNVARNQMAQYKYALLNPEPVLPGGEAVSTGSKKAPPPLLGEGKTDEKTGLSQKEAEDAVVAGKLSKQAFKALARKNGWNQPAAR